MKKERTISNNRLITSICGLSLFTLLILTCNIYDDDGEGEGRIHPKQVLLTGVTINDFPELRTNADTPWDESTGPDISLRLQKGDFGETLLITDTVLNAKKDAFYVLEFLSPILLPDIDAGYTLTTYDIDGGVFEYEVMMQAGITFTPGIPISPEDSISSKKRAANGVVLEFGLLYRF